jgi:hypothetical protein
MNVPESPEGVALELWRQIRKAEEKDEPEPRGRNRSRRADLLALYAECLALVRDPPAELWIGME